MVAVGYYPLTERPAMPLTPEDNGERIRWILDQLRQAPISGMPIGDGAGGFLGHISPTFQLVGTDSRLDTTIFAALDCRTELGGYSCILNHRDVVVQQGDRMTRVAAPALAEWRESDWESEARHASPEEYAALMGRLFPMPYVPSTDPSRMWLDSPPAVEVPQPLVAGRDGDSEVMRRVVGWLRTASAGSPDIESDTLFRGPLIPGINISWGNAGVMVRAAWLCTGGAASMGCVRSSDEVIVDDGRPFRWEYHLRSPELAGWLASGYLADMRMGTYEEYQREAHW